MSDLMESPTRCTARRKNGMRCHNHAIRGATVCRMHGGAAPQVLRAAQVRAVMASDRLMGALLTIALNEKIPVRDRLVAIRDGLDRAGLTARTQIDVQLEVPDWKAKAAGRVTPVVLDVDWDDLGPADDKIIDAEVVTDEEAERQARLDQEHADRRGYGDVMPQRRSRSVPATTKPKPKPKPRTRPQPVEDETPAFYDPNPSRPASDAEWRRQGRARAQREASEAEAKRRRRAR